VSFVAAQFNLPTVVRAYTSVQASLDVEADPRETIDAEIVLVAPDGTRTTILRGYHSTNPGGETSISFTATFGAPGEYRIEANLNAPTWTEQVTFDVRAS
jgi:hypothetical protein